MVPTNEEEPNMIRRIATRLAAATTLVASAAIAQQPDVEESAAPPLAERIELHGWVDLYYAWNRDDPADDTNFYPGYGNSAKRANELGVNLAALDVSLAPEPIGFRITAMAGNEMDALKAGEPAETVADEEVWRHLYQAYVSWRTDLGRGLQLDAGLYQGHAGFESPLPKDNWSYTQGWTGLLTPSYQAGLKLSYPFTDTFSGQLHVVNGWQITADNNDRPSYGTQLAWTPGRGSIVFNTWHGPELADDDETDRTLLDLIGSIDATDRLKLAAEAISGRQERPAPASGSDDWTIVSAWARWAFTERTALALRLERVDDEAGAITGHAQTVDALTVTVEHRPRPELALKLEARRDSSDVAVFDDHGTPTDEQTLLLGAAIFTF
jgi:hypothetical protein